MEKDIQQLTESLIERAKELECIYLVEEALRECSVQDSLNKISSVIPKGFRNTKKCNSVIELDGNIYGKMPDIDDVDELKVEIYSRDLIRGYIRVFYPKNTFPEDDVIFLEQEVRLLNNIAHRIAENIIKDTKNNYIDYRSQWITILNLLQKTDHSTLTFVCEKMLALLETMNPIIVQKLAEDYNWTNYNMVSELNYPIETLPDVDLISLSNIIFDTASKNLNDLQIYDYINLWIYQGRTYDLIKNVAKKDADKNSIAQALKAYIKAVEDSNYQSDATKRWLIAELTRRFITDNPKIISKIYKYIDVETFVKLLDSYICSPKSIGTIGGKASGLLVAYEILEARKEQFPELKNIAIPRTWYISSDEFKYILEDNGLDELNEHKYIDMLDIRIRYPRIIQRIKNAHVSPYILNELNYILDYSEDRPLIIRSSSILEDQVDTSFSGKYKSLFITNVGSKTERLRALVDGILEVYASMLNPDAIEYRKERDLLECDEKMGIIIQEVVGNKIGPYYFPLYAGVAFSNNEFRWSQRINREDGLVRMVMGLGTRAVDRVGEDYPILLSPGKPNLRVNHTVDEHQKYSPQYIDLIDLENNKFLTMPISELMKKCGSQIPGIQLIASELKEDILKPVSPLFTDFDKGNIVITFERLVKETQLLKQIKTILTILQKELGYPVDLEFASDGTNFYILQCRAQSRNHDNAPVAIPTELSVKKTVFTANKYVSNGKVTGINTVVYVDPYEYSQLESREDIFKVRDIISELNQILSRKSFILMGPGRWGSRGDIKLGVPVAYSDINNTAMLIEVASKKSKYNPELSFGTHFFQDLVEQNIKYLPLYPEDDNVIFNHAFFRANNALGEVLPKYQYLSEVVKVIKVDEVFPDNELIVLMNGDLQKAVAYIDYPTIKNNEKAINQLVIPEAKVNDSDAWKWRHYMAEQIANLINLEDFGVKGIYLIGSTSNYCARLNSDIDLIIHFDGNEAQKDRLNNWLQGWSLALSEINYLKTGYKTDGLLDIHYVTDQDIKDKTSFAVKINSVMEPALPLRIRGQKH